MMYPTSDLYDRYTIELLKRERAQADNESYLSELSDAISIRGRRADFIQKLYWINGLIWDLESDIRRGKEGELGLEEVGRRALAIRELNGDRITIKNKIAQSFGDYREYKYNHASKTE